jgi:hypothetical protein
MMVLKRLLATKSEDTGEQFEHEKATEPETDPVENIVDSLPFAVVKAFLATVFASDMIVSKYVSTYPTTLPIESKATPEGKADGSHICKLIKKSAKIPEISSDTSRITL